MDLDAPENPTPKEWASYLRYKRWQDRFRADSRPRLSQRFFARYVEAPLILAGLGCMWWGWGFGRPIRPLRTEVVLLSIAFGLLPLLIRKVFRIRPTHDA